jgi:hypothetical protein
MAVDKALADEQWFRYVYLRDNGHLDYVEKANLCDAYYMGNQWSKADKALLAAQRRPALTINKVLPTVDTVTGEQIKTRVDISFKPRKPGPTGEDLSLILEQLFRVVLDDNQYRWKETEMFEDGNITSRGFLDLRLSFRDNIRGEPEILLLNPRNVLPDSDADDYDPDTWNDVIITKWLSPFDIEVLYNKDDADYLRFNDPHYYSQEFDSVFREFETFRATPTYNNLSPVNREMRRDIRVIERQFRQLKRVKFFVDLATGDAREVPEGWDREKIGFVMKQYGLGVIEQPVKRIRWRVSAGPCVLHDDWSPYKHFTVIPYFPRFRRGKTIGLVENLLSPQEYLNKITSQELHVINTTANSGWKLKQGSLRNMEVSELEQRGAQTGIVLELGDVKDAEKIEPNQVPTGLDRISFKAEEYIKSISTVTDNAQGMDREDVAAKAIKAKQAVNTIPRARILDNMDRTRYILARNLLDLIQEYMTEPRIYRYTVDEFSQEQGELMLNQFDTASGMITNDLSLGEYEVVITTTPNKDTIMDSEFDQALAMREAGIQIPDEVLIKNSNLKSKRDIMRALQAQKNSPEAQNAANMQNQAQQLELQRMDSENDRIKADALLKTANAKARIAETAFPDSNGGGQGAQENPALEAARLQHEAGQQQADRDHEATQAGLDRSLEREKMQHESMQQSTQQQHDAGMARLGHSQALQQKGVEHATSMQEKEVDHAHQEQQARLGHKQSIEQGNVQHQHKVTETKVAAKARPKPAAKEKK